MDKEKPIYWSAIIPKIMHNLNTQKDISKDVSPFDIMCNRKPHLKENGKINNSFEFFLQSLMNLDEEPAEEDLIIEDNIENYIEENSTHNLLADVASYNNTTEITDIINTLKRTANIDGNGNKRMKQSAEKNSNENSFSHKANFGNKFKPMREILLEESSGYRSITLIENKSKLLISDYKRCLLHKSDFDGNILKSFNLNPIIERIRSVCVLESDSNEEKIFVADYRHNIFVFDSNFKLLFQFGNERLIDPNYMKIDNEFDKTRLYVSDGINHKIKIWSTVDGKFIDQIDIELPLKIIFARNSVFVSCIDERLDCCIFEIGKASLEIKRKIILNFDQLRNDQLHLLSIESNGNLQIAGYTDETLDDCDVFCFYFLTFDQNGKIIKKAKLLEYEVKEKIFDVILAHNKIIVLRENVLNIFEFE
jgi:hypothetical protein